ncbi:MAG: metallophosphoesterase [Bryobacter sp.]|nr:metallophosphoesterase [Bryobacter sp.]
MKAILLLCFASLLPAQQPYFDLIHISDTHIADFAGVHPDLKQARRANLDSLSTFETFSRNFSRTIAQSPRTALLHTGDIVDAVCFDGEAGQPVYGQIEFVKRTLAPLAYRSYLALGNHDVECYRRDTSTPPRAIGDQSVAAQARSLWAKQFRILRKRTYYSVPLKVAKTRYRLYVLDNGQSLDAGGREFFVSQMAWLEKELLRHPQERPLIAMHIPLNPAAANDERSRMALQALRAAKLSAVVLCGHRHSDALETFDNFGQKIVSVRTAALSRGPDTWRRIRLYADRVEVFATGPVGTVLATVSTF